MSGEQSGSPFIENAKTLRAFYASPRGIPLRAFSGTALGRGRDLG